MLVAGCANRSPVSPVAREFLRIPDRYLGALSHADRRFFLRETAGDTRIVDGNNLNFSWDGERPISGEGPFTLHLFSATARPTVGIFIERFYDTANHVPP